MTLPSSRCVVLCWCVMCWRSETATHQSWHTPRWRDEEEQQSGGGGGRGEGGSATRNKNTAKWTLGCLCITAAVWCWHPAFIVRNFICFNSVPLHCRPARAPCRCRGRGRCRATPCRAPTSPPPRARPPTTRPRRAAGWRCVSPSPGSPTTTTSRGRAPQKKYVHHISWIGRYLLHLIFIRCGSFMKNI